MAVTPSISNISNTNSLSVPVDYNYNNNLQLDGQSNGQNKQIKQNNVFGFITPDWANHISFDKGNGNVNLCKQEIAYKLNNNIQVTAQIKPNNQKLTFDLNNDNVNVTAEIQPNDQKLAICFKNSPINTTINVEHNNGLDTCSVNFKF